MSRYWVAKAEDVQPGQSRIYAVGNRTIGVFNVYGMYYALQNSCPHAGGPLCLGEITGTTVSPRPYGMEWIKSGEVLRCPWHEWEIDITTGRTITQPTRSVRTYRVDVEDGDLFLEI